MAAFTRGFVFINVAISLIIPLMLVFLTPISCVLSFSFSFSALGAGAEGEIADEGERVRLRGGLKQGK